MFNEIYCINLKEDIDRHTHMVNEFNKLNILDKVTFLAADRPPKNYKASNYHFAGEFGCALSHLKALIKGINSSTPIIIVEDDAVFTDNALNTLQKSVQDLPEDWSVIWLGGRPLERLKKYNDYLCKVGKFTQATAYMVNSKYIQTIAEFITDNISKDFPNACADNLLNNFVIQTNSGYCLYPPIAHQKDGYSTLRLGHRAYKKLTENEWIKYKP